MNRLILLFIILPSICLGNKVIDSLETQLESAKGKDRVGIFLELGIEYQSFDSAKSATYLHRALQLSSDNDYHIGLAEAHNELGVLYARRGHSLIGGKHFKKSSEFYLKTTDSLDGASTLKNLAAIKYQLGELDTALKVLQRSISFAPRNPKTRKDSFLMGNIYNTLGVVYDELSDHKIAINNYFKALDIYNKINNRDYASDAYFNIASAYSEMGYHDQTIKYAKKAWEIDRKISFEVQSHVINLIGITHAEKGDYEKAINFYQKILDHKNQVSNHTYGVTLGNLGISYFKLGWHDEAIKAFRESMKVRKEVGQKKGLIYGYMNLAEVYNQKENYSKALTFIDSSYSLAREAGFKGDVKDILRIKSEILAGKGIYKKAFETYKNYSSLSDSLLNENVSGQIEEIRAKYETAEKEKAIQKLEKETALQQLENQRQQKFIFLLLLTLVLIGSFGGFVFYRRQQQHKQEMKEQEISFQKQLLKETIEAQEEERQKIAKDLHDGIGQQLGGLKMAAQSIHPQTQEEKDKLKKVTKVLDDTAEEVRNISHQMMPRILSEDGLVAALEDMLDKTFSYNENIDYSFEYHGLKSPLQKHLEIGLYRICQELVNNIIKHSEADFASVQLLKSGRQLALIVEDNGNGFNHEDNKKGIGMKTIESRINSISGKINFEPSPNAGTIATVRVPVDE